MVADQGVSPPLQVACVATEMGFPPFPGLAEDEGGAVLSRSQPLGRQRTAPRPEGERAR